MHRQAQVYTLNMFSKQHIHPTYQHSHHPTRSQTCHSHKRRTNMYSAWHILGIAPHLIHAIPFSAGIPAHLIRPCHSLQIPPTRPASIQCIPSHRCICHSSIIHIHPLTSRPTTPLTTPENPPPQNHRSSSPHPSSSSHTPPPPTAPFFGISAARWGGGRGSWKARGWGR